MNRLRSCRAIKKGAVEKLALQQQNAGTAMDPAFLVECSCSGRHLPCRILPRKGPFCFLPSTPLRRKATEFAVSCSFLSLLGSARSLAATSKTKARTGPAKRQLPSPFRRRPLRFRHRKGDAQEARGRHRPRRQVHRHDAAGQAGPFHDMQIHKQGRLAERGGGIRRGGLRRGEGKGAIYSPIGFRTAPKETECLFLIEHECCFKGFGRAAQSVNSVVLRAFNPKSNYIIRFSYARRIREIANQS